MLVQCDAEKRHYSSGSGVGKMAAITWLARSPEWPWWSYCGCGPIPTIPTPTSLLDMQDTGSPTHIGESLGTEEGARLQGGHHNIELQCSTVPASMFVHTKPLPLCAQKPDAWFYSALENHTNRGEKNSEPMISVDTNRAGWWRPKQNESWKLKKNINVFLVGLSAVVANANGENQQKDSRSFCNEVRS